MHLSIAKARGLQTDSQMLRFSLLQLPVNAQETYKILLTVPIGAFIILLLRNFIGLKTFGTFMPVLIAFAFRETHVIWGITLFIIIVSFGLLARFYLDQFVFYWSEARCHFNHSYYIDDFYLV